MMQWIRDLGLASKTLLYVAAALSIVIAIEIVTFSRAHAIGEVAAGDATSVAEVLADAQNVAPPVVRPLTAYNEIVERPVFDVTRRPPPPGATQAVSQGASQMSKQWKLTGVVKAGDATYALVEGKRDRRTVRLQQGELLDGWRLDEIGADRITLVSGTQTVSLELHQEPVPGR